MSATASLLAASRLSAGSPCKVDCRSSDEGDDVDTDTETFKPPNQLRRTPCAATAVATSKTHPVLQAVVYELSDTEEAAHEMDPDEQMPSVLGHSERTTHASVPKEEGQSTIDRGAQSP